MLESYIAPILMGYVSKYIKNLRPSDLSLSVWGGDVVLQNLELNLDVLQTELHLPIKFLSGKIHQLQLHVPWTKILYEPVVITINTIEFIVKLREPNEAKTSENSDITDDSKKEIKKELQMAKLQKESEQLPPGYVQGLLNKVINNVCICVNNLILKYTEDDIVFSLNIKSVEIFSSDKDWARAFVDLVLPDLCLRKVCNITGLTICLDRRNADGKIEMYQDPFLYKCNLSCRMLSKFESTSSTSPYEIKFNVYCESLDVSLTDEQLPMCIRLLKLVIGLYYGTLDLPGCEHNTHPAKEILEERHMRKSLKYGSGSSKVDGTDEDTSWTSWAWSMVPALTDTSAEELKAKKEPTLFIVGIFVTQTSLTLKATDHTGETNVLGAQRFEFAPIMSIELSGCALEIMSRGEDYFDCQLGVSNIVGYCIGDCLCCRDKGNPMDDADTSITEQEEEEEDIVADEDELFLKVGNPKETTANGIGFLENSLFNSLTNSQEDSQTKKTDLPERGNQYSEIHVMQKYGAFFLDYFYTMELPAETEDDEDEDIVTPHDRRAETEIVKEVSLKRLIVGPSKVFISATLLHSFQMLVKFTQDDSPPRKEKDEVFVDPFVIKQLKLGNLPTKTLHVTCHPTNIVILPADHVSENSNKGTLQASSDLPGVLVQIDRVDFQKTDPMFPIELSSLLEKQKQPKAILLRAAFSDQYLKEVMIISFKKGRFSVMAEVTRMIAANTRTQFFPAAWLKRLVKLIQQVFGFQLGLCQLDPDNSENVVLNVVPPSYASVYLKQCILPEDKANDSRIQRELRVEAPSFTISLTKAQLLLILYIFQTWTSKQITVAPEGLLDDVFHPTGGKEKKCLSVLDVSFIGFQVKCCETSLVHCAKGSLGSWKASLQTLRKGQVSCTPVLYAPLKTGVLSDVRNLVDEETKVLEELPNGAFISFTVQLPKFLENIKKDFPPTLLLEVKGIVLNIIPDVLEWISYEHQIQRKRIIRPLDRKLSRLPSKSFSASTPKRKSYTRAFGTSIPPSKFSKERSNKDEELKSKKTGQTPEGKRVTLEDKLNEAVELLNALVMKVDIETVAVFISTENINCEMDSSSPNFNIPFVLRSSYHRHPNNFPSVLVTTFPQLKVKSTCEITEPNTDIPVHIPSDSASKVVGSLPWSINGSGFSVYTLFSQNVFSTIQDYEQLYIWQPSKWSLFLAAAQAAAVSSKDPPSPSPYLEVGLSAVGVKPVMKRVSTSLSVPKVNSQNQSSLGFCVHADLEPLFMAISKKQIKIVTGTLSYLKECIESVISGKQHLPVSLKSFLFPTSQKTNQSVSGNDLMSPQTAENQSVSATSSNEVFEVLSVSTETSYGYQSQRKDSKSKIALSLWLQWTIPKLTLSFFGDAVESRLVRKVALELEELSFAFDYQNGEIQTMSKIGTFTAKHFSRRLNLPTWKTGAFGGILVSSQDTLLSIGNILQKEATSRTFLSMSYTKSPFTESIQKHRNSPETVLQKSEGGEIQTDTKREKPLKVIQELSVYQHEITCVMQPLDIVLYFPPLLDVNSIFSDLDTFANYESSTTKDTSPRSGPPQETEQKIAVYSPLPKINFQNCGIRISMPLTENPAALGLALLSPKFSASASGVEFSSGLASLSSSSESHLKPANFGNENLIMLHLQSVSLSSEPDNRISSSVVNKDWFRCLRKFEREKGRRSKQWSIQYQAAVKGVSLWSGCWNNLCKREAKKDRELRFELQGQNPALEWNYEIGNLKERAHLTPVVFPFDVQTTLAPSIHLTLKDTNEVLTLTTSSAEVSVSKDLKIWLNPDQMNLFLRLANEYSRNPVSGTPQDNITTVSTTLHPTVTPEKKDSGICSVLSGKTTIVSDMKEKLPDSSVTEMTPLELFASGAKISFSFYYRENSEDHESIVPFMYFESVQPTMSASSIHSMRKLDFSLFDFSMRTASVPTKSTSLHLEKEAFSQCLIETSKGKRNPKTGLYQEFMTLNIIIDEGSGSLDLNFGRPISINVCLNIIANIENFLANIDTSVNATDSRLKADSNETGKSLVDDQKPPIGLNTACFKTNRIMFRVSASHSAVSTVLEMAVRSVNGKATFNPSLGDKALKSGHTKFSVDGFQVSLHHGNRHCCLVTLCIFDFECLAEFINHSGPSSLPKLTFWYESGLVRFRFGQQRLKLITSLIDEVNRCFDTKSEKSNADSFVKNEMDDTAAKGKYSSDDLRNGTFIYGTQTGGEIRHPDPNEILFVEEIEERQPSMTWRYEEPRFITEISITPLPFSLENDSDNEITEIPCALRYWDTLENCYVTYCHFFLSESKQFKLYFPDPSHDVFTGKEQVAAEEWQVVVDVAVEVESVASEFSVTEDLIEEAEKMAVISSYKTPVSATSLAACMKVDSCYIPEKVPFMLASISIGSLQLAVVNSFDSIGQVSPQRFYPFFLDSDTYPDEQEAFNVILDQFSCKMCLHGFTHSSAGVEVETNCSMDVLDFKDLTWRHFIRPFNVTTSVSTGKPWPADDAAFGELEESKHFAELSLRADKIDVCVSQSTVHTLGLTANTWKGKDERKLEEISLMNHYIICNETQDSIRFGQVNTDEDILIASGQMYPYSWRSSKDRKLHLCLDSVGDWKWCHPFEIDSDDCCTLVIQHSTHKSVLIIEVKRVGGIQRQIIIKGSLVFRNLLETDVEFDIVMQHVETVGPLQQQKITQVNEKFIVPSHTSRPSFTVSPDAINVLSLRLVGDEENIGNWTEMLPVVPESQENDVLKLLELQRSGGKYNCWYKIIKPESQLDQTTVCVCPMFIVRNHLKWPVVMTAIARDDETKFSFTSKDCGGESEVSGLAASTWYNVTFQLSATDERTNPPIPLNTTLVDLLSKKGRTDDTSRNYEQEWPYQNLNSDESLPFDIQQYSTSMQSESKKTKQSNKPSSVSDLECQLVQKWAMLPTIVIEVKPKVLITNQTALDLTVKDIGTEFTWELGAGSTLTSPAVQNSFALGLSINSPDPMWSKTIEFSMVKPVAVENEGSNNQTLLLTPNSSSSCSIVNERNQTCHQFSLNCKLFHGMAIIIVKERFCIRSSVSRPLHCFPVLRAEEQPDIKVENFTPLDIPSDETEISFSCLQLILAPKASPSTCLDLADLLICFFFDLASSTRDELDNANVFNLSHDHLRETIMLKEDLDGFPTSIVMTSCLQDGVIQVLLADDLCPFVMLKNECSFQIMFFEPDITKQVAMEKAQSVEDLALNKQLIALTPGETSYYSPRTFKEDFPRVDNEMKFSLRFAVVCDSILTVSEPVNISRGLDDLRLSMGNKVVKLVSFSVANCLKIYLHNPEYVSLPKITDIISLPGINVSMSQINLITMDEEATDTCKEVLSVTLNGVNVSHSYKFQELAKHMPVRTSRVLLDIRCLQVDNQLLDIFCHFPVVLLPLRARSERYHGNVDHSDVPFAETKASSEQSFFSLSFSAYKCATNGTLYMDDIRVHLEPTEIYLEDTLIYRIVGLLESFSPPLPGTEPENPNKLSQELENATKAILNPLNLGDIKIDDISILLSIQASVKIFLATDHMPVVLGKLQIPQTITVGREFLRTVLYHYATQALVRAGLMLGSLEMIGNPTGFIRNVGEGAADFFRLPYEGLIRGPSSFVKGIGQGASSFVKHISIGTLTSITNFASSISRNMDRLCLDEQHLLWQEQRRTRSPGIIPALSSLGLSFLGAVAGVVDHPLQNIQRSSGTKDAVKGVVSGLGKGIVGMVTKPIGGAMEFVSQAGQGILKGTGLIKAPFKARQPRNESDATDDTMESEMKFAWKVFHLEEVDNLFIVGNISVALPIGKDKETYEGSLILTPTSLYLYQRCTNNIRQAFSNSDINLRQDEGQPQIVYVDKQKSKMSEERLGIPVTTEGQANLQQFFESFQRTPLTPVTINSSNGMVNVIQAAKSQSIAIHINPTFASLLVSQFSYNKCIVDEKMTAELDLLEITPVKSEIGFL